MVVPYRAGNREFEAKYEAILTNGRGLTLAMIDLPVVRLAAEIRASTSVRTADTVHLASALLAGRMAFLTNDRRLPAFGDLQVLQLETFAARV